MASIYLLARISLIYNGTDSIHHEEISINHIASHVNYEFPIAAELQFIKFKH